MNWTSNPPKTDWDADDAPTQTDFNRIETNINGTRFGQGDLGANIISANNLPIVKDFHIVTGSTAVMYLSTTGYLAGAKVALLFQETNVTIHHDEPGTPPVGFAPIYLATADRTTGVANTLLEFIYDGTYWRVPTSTRQLT
jgi:hypothetical protein